MRAALLIVLLPLSAAPAAAGGLSMGITAGPAPRLEGHAGNYFDGRGHLSFAFTMGGEVGGVTIDLVTLLAGYDAVFAPPYDAALLLGGIDVGRRVALGPRLTAAAELGLHLAQILRMTDADQIPEALRFGGFGWSLGVEAAYRLGRLKSRAPPSNPIRFLTAELVAEARRERLFLSNDYGGELTSAATVVTLGLRFGAEL